VRALINLGGTQKKGTGHLFGGERGKGDGKTSNRVAKREASTDKGGERHPIGRLGTGHKDEAVKVSA